MGNLSKQNELRPATGARAFDLFDKEDGSSVSGRCWVDEDGVVHFEQAQPDRDEDENE